MVTLQVADKIPHHHTKRPVNLQNYFSFHPGHSKLHIITFHYNVIRGIKLSDTRVRPQDKEAAEPGKCGRVKRKQIKNHDGAFL